MSSFKRLLKLAEKLHEANDTKGLQKLELQFQNYIKAHYVADNDGTTPIVWRHNMDYASWENSPFRGSMSEFLKEFPGGIKDWLDWRKNTKKERFKNWDIKTRKAKLEYMMKTGEADYEPTKEDLEESDRPTTKSEKDKSFELVMKNIEMFKEMADLTDEDIRKWVESKYGKFGQSAEDKGDSKAYVGSIEKDTEDNKFFRKVLFTGEHSQLVVMSVEPEEELGSEVHPHIDQFFRIEEGEADFILNGEKHHLEAGGAVTIPAGTEHNVINTSKTETLQVYTIYSPPNHPHGTIHKTKEDAEKAEKEEQKGEEKKDNDNELREKLADLEHKQWAHWTKYMLENLSDREKARWERQIDTDYKDLSEKEKDGDREWADKVLDILKIKAEAHYVPVGGDDVKKFNKEPHLFSDKGLDKYKSIKQFLKTYHKHYGRGQSADDAAHNAIRDMINYWKLLLKAKGKRGKDK
jgi:mannose-6-phosphate isomerase-like protein (cupin superfamily)